MKKVLFAVGDLRMGGTQRVQSVIGNEVFSMGYESRFFSLRKVTSYFQVDFSIFYPRNAVGRFKFFSILCSTGIQKFLLRKPVDMMVVPGLAIVEEFVSYVKNNGIQTVVLVEQWLVVADKVKKALPDVKVIGWLHSNAFMYESYFFVKSADSLIRGYQSCDILLALTREDQDYLLKYAKENVKVMHNPLTIINECTSELTSKVISFTGRIDINTKGLDYLIEIAKQLEDGWQIHVAGQGSTLEELRFRGMIQKHHLQEKVIWKGARKDGRLIQHYLNSSIFISISRIEGFGLVLVEAMSFGLPVLAFENSGSREVTENGRFGILVEQGNVERFCEQLKLLMDSKELREKYQKLSLERVPSFSLERIVYQWEEII